MDVDVIARLVAVIFFGIFMLGLCNLSVYSVNVYNS